jgi:hypothetical protein
MRPALLAIALTALLIALAGCASAAEQALVPPGTGAGSSPSPRPRSTLSRAELLRRQERLDAVATAIQDLVDPLEGRIAKRLPSGENRFAEVRIDLHRDRVELWWAGPLPAEVRSVLAAHPDVITDVHRATFSNNELQAAGDSVARFLRTGRAGSDVTTDAIEHDARSGRLTVHVIDPHDRWTVRALHRRLDPLTRVPLDIVRQHRPTLVGL